MKSRHSTGFVLTELLVTGLLTAFLMLGIVQMAAGASRGLLLIESQSHNQQGGRFAIDQVRGKVMSAGFHPSPWDLGVQFAALGDSTLDGGPEGSDTLVLRTLSDKNCYENPNGTLGADGEPAFFLRESKFELSGSGNLAHTCWYGPDENSMVRQINREGLVQYVESFQTLFAEDTDGDRLADRLVRAQNWDDGNNIVGIQLGFLVASDKPVGEGLSSTTTVVLDQSVSPPSDGRIRKTWTANIPLASRLR